MAETITKFLHKKKHIMATALILLCVVLCRETQSVVVRQEVGLLSATKTLTWRERGGRQRRCCRVSASPLTYITVHT